ncbi:MAG: hypothetical protein M1824_001972 [Vezdaea acicularis]|nr:MAG: hypothetical protein M1824_001972 [Vezdaea acicularis]
MAEGVFRSLSRTHPSIGVIDSCGTGAYHVGDSPDTRTMAVLRDNGITDYVHGARQVTLDDFTNFDYILAMDKYNLRDLERLRTRATSKGSAGDKKVAQVMLFGDFGGTKGEEVGDPYYGARHGFEIAYEQMVRFSEGFFKEVEKRED